MNEYQSRVEGVGRLHDSKIISIAFGSHKVILIEFLTTSAQRMTVEFRGVVNFYCNGMLEGNIVESMEVTTSKDIAQEDLAYFVRREGRGQSVEQLEKTIKTNELSLVFILPSYGAEIGCVCAKIQQSSP
jgi:hypothetical protein